MVTIGIICIILGAVAVYFAYKTYKLHKLYKLVPKSIDNRIELVQQWVANARAATKSIVAISYSVGPSADASDEERSAWKKYLDILEDKCSNKEFKARILASARTERIEALFSRRRAGAEIRVNERVDRFDFRFQICDGERMVLNVPSAHTKTSRSESGIEIKVKSLIDFCLKTFNQEWSDQSSIDFDKFVEDELCRHIPNVLEQYGPKHRDTLIEQTGIPSRVVDHYLERLVKAGKLVIREDGYYSKDPEKI